MFNKSHTVKTDNAQLLHTTLNAFVLQPFFCADNYVDPEL